MKSLFIFGLFEDTYFGRFCFAIMQIVVIWAILGLVYVSHTKSDILLNLIQLSCYILFMFSTHNRMERQKWTF